MIYEIYLQWSIYNYKNVLGIVANSNQQFMQVTGHICKRKTLIRSRLYTWREFTGWNGVCCTELHSESSKVPVHRNQAIPCVVWWSRKWRASAPLHSLSLLPTPLSSLPLASRLHLSPPMAFALPIPSKPLGCFQKGGFFLALSSHILRRLAKGLALLIQFPLLQSLLNLKFVPGIHSLMSFSVNLFFFHSFLGICIECDSVILQKN